MADEEQDKPKIIVDDDWKTRVQAEKEALKQQKEEGPTESKPEEAAGEAPLPPASFAMLVTSLATQAIASMGQIPDADGKGVVRLDHAKHAIDTLAVLEEKTKGNLTQEEAAMLEQILHEMRMLYVAVSKNPKPPPAEASE